MNLNRMKNKSITKIISYLPALSSKLVNSYKPRESTEIPWTSVTKLLSKSKVAIVTTAGVHHINDDPYNMIDPNGDPTFRSIHTNKADLDLMITPTMTILMLIGI